MIRTTIFLTPKQHDRLLLESETRGLSMAEIMRRAIDDYFRTRPPPEKVIVEETHGEDLENPVV